MKESLSIFITVIILVLLIVVFPLYNYFERQDDMSYNLVLKATTEFIDEIRNCGYISQDMYTNYIFQIANTGNLYNIELEAYRKVLVINDSKTGYDEQYLIDYDDDIFSDEVVSGSSSIDNKVIKNGVYRLNVGDKIFIKLKNSSTTMAGALFNIIVPTSSPETIKINYGGIVQNNTWKESETALFDEFNFKLNFDLNTNGDNNATYNNSELQNGIKTVIYTGSNLSKVTIPNAIPSRTNCTFKGWALEKSSKTVKYKPGESIKMDSNITLYAVWEEGNVTITFNPNGGTIKEGDTGTKTVKYGNQILILPTALRDGYEFDSWYTAPTGGEKVSSTTRVTTTNNITYYAHWKNKKITVTYAYNDATSGNVDANKEVIVTDKYGSLPSPTKEGYIFAGWYLDSDLTKEINANSIVSMNVDHTIYAKWSANAYTITFNANGGSVTPTSKTQNYGTALSLPTPTRTGYKFEGWYTAATGGTVRTYVTMPALNETLYAHWTVNSSTLTVNPNNGNVNNNTSSFNVTKNSGEEYILTVNSYPSAYTVTLNGNGGISPSALISKRNNVSWSKNGGGSLSGNVFTFSNQNATVTASYSGSTSVTLPDTSRTSTNYCTYSFSGWYTTNSGGTKVSSSYTPNSNITLYAHWTATYKTAKLDHGFNTWLNVHSTASANSSVVGYIGKNSIVTVYNYNNSEGYYYVQNIWDAYHSKYVSGWIWGGALTFQ